MVHSPPEMLCSPGLAIVSCTLHGMGQRYKDVYGMKNTLLSASLIASFLTGLPVTPIAAQDAPAKVVPPSNPPPAVLKLTLDEAKERVLSNNKLLALAAHNVQSKEYATRALQANYFPQI